MAYNWSDMDVHSGGVMPTFYTSAVPQALQPSGLHSPGHSVRPSSGQLDRPRSHSWGGLCCVLAARSCEPCSHALLQGGPTRASATSHLQHGAPKPSVGTGGAALTISFLLCHAGVCVHLRPSLQVRAVVACHRGARCGRCTLWDPGKKQNVFIHN
jgi:hypothetical protein